MPPQTYMRRGPNPAAYLHPGSHTRFQLPEFGNHSPARAVAPNALPAPADLPVNPNISTKNRGGTHTGQYVWRARPGNLRARGGSVSARNKLHSQNGR